MKADRLAGIVGTVVMAALAAWAQYEGRQTTARAEVGHNEVMQAWVSCEIERRECSESCGE